jgi:muconolactone delta-isomerase
LRAETTARRTLGLWSAGNTAEMTTILKSLPLYAWMTLEITPLAAHPNDPGGSP